MSLLKFAIHPGRILWDEYLEPAGMSAIAFARHLGVPRSRIERLVKEETSITVETAMMFARAFRTTPQFWMNMQASYDLACADTKIAKDIEPLQLSA